VYKTQFDLYISSSFYFHLVLTLTVSCEIYYNSENMNRATYVLNGGLKHCSKPAYLAA